MGRVERKQTRLQGRNIATASGANALGGIEECLVIGAHHHIALAMLQASVQALAQATGFIRARDHAIDDHLDAVPLIAVEFRNVLQAHQLFIHAHAHKSALAQILEQGLVGALAVANQGRAQHHFLPLVDAQDLLRQGLGGPRAHGFLAVGTMGNTGPGKQHAQVVGDLGQSTDGRTRATRHTLLIHGDRGRKAFDALHIRLGQAAQKLPRVPGESLQEAPLSLAEQGVKSERRFARTTEPGNGHQGSARQVHAHAAQVVLTRAPNPDLVGLRGRDRGGFGERFRRFFGHGAGCRRGSKRVGMARSEATIVPPRKSLAKPHREPTTHPQRLH